jgi:Centriolar protein SAS N-terminal domain
MIYLSLYIIGDGFRVVYDRELPVEIRESETPDELGQLHQLKAKILVLGEESEPQAIRVEVSSESDLFFHYYHTVDDEGFRELQQQQKLMIQFIDYANVLIRMFNQCIKSPHTHMTIMYVGATDTARIARMDFLQNMEYKFIELLSVDYVQTAQDLVKHHITYRYHTAKNRVAMLHTRLQEINQIIKLKNPSLLLQIQKATGSGSRSPSKHTSSSVH